MTTEENFSNKELSVKPTILAGLSEVSDVQKTFNMSPRTSRGILKDKPTRNIVTIVDHLIPPSRALLENELTAIIAAISSAQFNDLDEATAAMNRVKELQTTYTDVLNKLSEVRKLIATDLAEIRRERARAKKAV